MLGWNNPIFLADCTGLDKLGHTAFINLNECFANDDGFLIFQKNVNHHFILQYLLTDEWYKGNFFIIMHRHVFFGHGV